MKKMAKIEYLRKKLVNDKELNVKRESEVLKVSERTTRRYFDEIFSLGICTKFHGGLRLRDIGTGLIVNRTIDEWRSVTLISKSEKVARKDVDSGRSLYVFGSFNLDVVTELSRFPQVGETITATTTNFYPGGKGANQAAAAAQLNDRVHFFVKVGKDTFGDNAEKYFASSRLQSVALVRDEKHNTGNALVMVEENSGNNSIVIDLGANAKVTHDEIIGDYTNLSKASVCLLQLENNIDATRYMIELAKEAGCYVILNPAPYSEDINAHLHLVDLLTPNETEAELLTGVKITDIETAEEAIKIIHKMGVSEIVITLGSKGSLYYNGDILKHYKAMKATVVDTTGAGDAFNGSLAASLVDGVNIDNAIKLAVAFSSLAVEKNGASSMPSRSMVLDRLKNGKFVE